MDLSIMAGWSMIDMASGDDDSGTSATRANYEWARVNWASKEDIKFVYGGSGSYGVAYRLETSNSDIHEAIHAMYEFGCIQDEILHRVEADWIADAKESWVLFDFMRQVEETFGDDIFQDVSKKTIDSIFDQCCTLSGEQWSFEGTAYIDLHRLVPHFQVAISSL